MRKKGVFFVLIGVLVVSMFATIGVLADNDTLVCHKPGTPAEHWLLIARAALDAHIAHGDKLWPSVVECGGVVIPAPTGTSDPVYTAEPTADAITPQATVQPTAQVTVTPVPIFVRLFLPLIDNGCPNGWPWCSVPTSK